MLLWFNGQQLANWLGKWKKEIQFLVWGPFAFAQAGAAGLFISLSPGGEAAEVRAPIVQLFLELWHPSFDLEQPILRS